MVTIDHISTRSLNRSILLLMHTEWNIELTHIYTCYKQTIRSLTLEGLGFFFNVRIQIQVKQAPWCSFLPSVSSLCRFKVLQFERRSPSLLRIFRASRFFRLCERLWCLLHLTKSSKEFFHFVVGHPLISLPALITVVALPLPLLHSIPLLTRPVFHFCYLIRFDLFLQLRIIYT